MTHNGTAGVDRRGFLVAAAGVAAGLLVGGGAARGAGMRGSRRAVALKLSLAQWTFHRSIQGGKMTSLDFAKRAKGLGFDAIEYVNGFLREKSREKGYVEELNKRAADQGVQQLLIMCDGEGLLGAAAKEARQKSVDGHAHWLEVARAMGCHSIRVNGHGEGTREEQTDRVAEGVRALCERAEPLGLNVLVENHGGYSSNGAWLAGLIRKVAHARCGTLPDFNNWTGANNEKYDRYKGMAELLPYAKALSAKSVDFDAEGNETSSDYRRMVKLALDAGYSGYYGVEYEGSRLSEDDGVRATKKLLERVAAEMKEQEKPAART